jgi:hypothetical protein
MRNWVAYCMTCHKKLEECPSGPFAEAAAQLHADGMDWSGTAWVRMPDPAHEVIVGYRVERHEEVVR